MIARTRAVRKRQHSSSRQSECTSRTRAEQQILQNKFATCDMGIDPDQSFDEQGWSMAGLLLGMYIGWNGPFRGGLPI